MTSYRLAVLSDIHANLTALDTVLSVLDRFAPLDAILVAGDFTYGPSQPETLARLVERRVIAVRGNGDVDLLNFADGKSPAYMQTLQQFTLIRWALANTTPDALDFLRKLPEQQVITFPGADPIRLVHGSPRDVNENLNPDENPALLNQVLATLSEPVLVFGHSHQPLKKEWGGRLALNPGAVSMAIGRPATAYFAILEWPDQGTGWQAELHSVPYDLESHRKEFVKSGLLAIGPLGPLLFATSQTGNNVGVDYMHYAFALAKEAGYGELPYVPDDIWEQAAKNYPWDHLDQ
jgi:putative phosphoesterase